MTTNYRVRKNKNPINVETDHYGMYAGHDALRTLNLPRLSAKAVRNLRHGDVVYRGLIRAHGVEITEYRVMGRPQPHLAFTHGSNTIRKDRLDTLNTVYVLHARDNGARRDHEASDFPMSYKDKVKLAKASRGFDELRVPVVSSCSWSISRDSSRYYSAWGRAVERHDAYVMVSTPASAIISSMKEFYLHTDRLHTLQSKISTHLYYASDLRSGSFLVRTKRQALSIAHRFMTTAYGLNAMLAFAAEDQYERDMERSMEEDYYGDYDDTPDYPEEPEAYRMVANQKRWDVLDQNDSVTLTAPNKDMARAFVEVLSNRPSFVSLALASKLLREVEQHDEDWGIGGYTPPGAGYTRNFGNRDNAVTVLRNYIEKCDPDGGEDSASDEAEDDNFSLPMPHPEEVVAESDCTQHMTDQQLRAFGVED